MITPGLRALARSAPLPLQRRRQPGDRGQLRRAGDERPLRRRPARDPVGAVRHLHPLARAACGRRGPARVLAPGRLAHQRPRGGRDRAPAGRARGRAAGRPAVVAGLAGRGGDGGLDAAGGARADRQRLLRAEPRGARGYLHAAVARRHDLLRAPGPRHRAQPELGRDRLSRAPGSAGVRARTPAGDPPPGDAGGDDRGRRLRRRLGCRRRRDRGRARGRGQVRGGARGRRLPRRRRLRRARALGLPADVHERRAVSDRRGPGLDRRRHRCRRRHRGQLDQLPAHPRSRSRRVGRRARAGRPRRVRVRRPPRRRLRAPPGQRGLQRPQRPPPAPAGGVRVARL